MEKHKFLPEHFFGVSPKKSKKEGRSKTHRDQIEQGRLLSVLVELAHKECGHKSENVGRGSRVEIQISSPHLAVIIAKEERDENSRKCYVTQSQLNEFVASKTILEKINGENH